MIINSNRFYILNTKRVQKAFLPVDLAKTLLFEDHTLVSLDVKLLLFETTIIFDAAF